MENIEPALKHVRQMLSDFEAISMRMAEPGVDIDSLSGKMERLQARRRATPRFALPSLPSLPCGGGVVWV